ncbi:MAG: hypothetical protein ACK4F9_05965 [Brevinematia bacterium]
MLRFITKIFLILFILSSYIFAFSQEIKKESTSKYFEVYRVIGKGKDINEAIEDAYQNAIIDFLKKYVESKDLKENSEKILKEIFPSKKIKEFIESYKILSSEESSGSVKIVIDIVVRSGKITESLNKIKVPLKSETSNLEKNKEEQSK